MVKRIFLMLTVLALLLTAMAITGVGAAFADPNCTGPPSDRPGACHQPGGPPGPGNFVGPGGGSLKANHH